MKSLFLLISMMTAFTAQAAFYSPPELVGYFEGEEGYLWSIGHNAGGKEVINVQVCPADAWINSRSDCGAPVAIMLSSEFKAYALTTVITWATQNLDKALDPLTAESINSLAAAANLVDLNDQRAALDKDLKKAEEMLVHLPNSIAYQTKRDTALAEIKKIDATLKPIETIQVTVSNLAESILKLIGTNRPDGKFNFYARSQMQNSFLHVVMKDLGKEAIAKAAEAAKMAIVAADHDLITTVPPGNRCHIKRLVDGWANQLWCKGTFKEKFIGNFRDSDTAEITALAAAIRALQAKGEW